MKIILASVVALLMCASLSGCALVNCLGDCSESEAWRASLHLPPAKYKPPYGCLRIHYKNQFGENLNYWQHFDGDHTVDGIKFPSKSACESRYPPASPMPK